MIALLCSSFWQALPKALIIIGICFLALFLICFVLSFIGFKITFGRPSKKTTAESTGIYSSFVGVMKQGREYFLSLNPKDVYITSFDGLKLHAYFYEHPQSKGTVVLMHGYHGNPLLGYGPVFDYFINRGYSILLTDHRAHGKSEGKYLTFGVKESKDCADWAKYIAKNYPSRPISIHGVSMGGATVCMASDLPDLPSEVKLMVNDCGYTTPDEIVSRVRKSMHIPFFPFHLFLRFFAKTLAGFSLKEKSSTKCVANSTLPQLFIHGGQDKLIPYEMGLSNYNASNGIEKRMALEESAGHGLAYITNKEKITKDLDYFYGKYIG